MSSIEVSEEAGVRFLHFGSEWVQGAMRVARPWALELEYTREMMAALLLRDAPDFPASALLVGLGAGSLLKFLYRHRPGCRLDVVEIDPAVVPMARFHFRVPDDPARIHTHVADAVQWIETCDATYDLILVDGFDHKARAGGLEAREFYAACRARLSERGVLAANVFGNRKGYRQAVRNLELAFAGRVAALPSCDGGNVIVLAAAGEWVSLSLADLRESSEALQRETGLNLRPLLARLTAAQVAEGLSI